MSYSPPNHMQTAPSSIIIADDDEGICTVLRQAFTRKGYRVQITHDGAELLDWVLCGQGDIVISDVIMPSLNGLEALREIRRHREDLPIIIISAKSTFNTAIEASANGANEYFPKPFDLHALTECVERLLAQTTPKSIQLDPHRSVFAMDSTSKQQLIGSSPAMQHAFRTIAKLVNVDLTVLLRGESGTGKEVIARAIHITSSRKTAPFIASNVAAIPKDLLESELFGHEKGAFTGANHSRKGAFAQAEGGTLFLDEIGDMPFEAQTRLLRVIQEHEYTPLGSSQPLPCNVRIICATHQDLEQLCKEKRFREDLFYRLNVVPIFIPPLRERREDIPELIQYFLKQAATKGLPRKTIEHSANEMLGSHPWHGNVRELENMILRLCALSPADTITAENVRACLPAITSTPLTQNSSPNFQNFSSLTHTASQALHDFFTAHNDTSPPKNLYDRTMTLVEAPLLRETLRFTNGNQLRASEILGINRNTLRTRLRALNIDINNLDTP